MGLLSSRPARTQESSNHNLRSSSFPYKHNKHDKHDKPSKHDRLEANSLATDSPPQSEKPPNIKPFQRNRSFGDFHRMKEKDTPRKHHLPRNLSYGDIRRHRHHDLHSVSKRFQQVLGRSESFRESREAQAITFKSNFQNHYHCDLACPLSHGRYATVTVAQSYLTGETVAVKIISKDRLYDRRSGRRCAGENVRVEVLALRNLANQPNVVKFMDVYEDEAFFYVIMELCKGGNLLERVHKVRHMKEEQAGPLLKQMLAVTNVCHAQGIAHRDLKLENFVFSSAAEDYPLKLVDFGSAAFFRSGQSHPFKGAAGTFNYMAPEVFETEYGPRADVWSLGVVGFALLCGQLPFSGTSTEELKDKILHTELNFLQPTWVEVSESARDLLTKMLQKNPDFRITIDEALSHAWFKGRGAGEGRGTVDVTQ